MTDQDIIALFFARDETAIQQTQLKYGTYCEKVTAQILKDPLDREECLNETLLKVWNAIPPQRPNNFKLYLAVAARNTAFCRYRSQTAQKRGGVEVDVALEELGECVSSVQSAEDKLYKKELGEAVNRFLDGLSSRERRIFLRRYFFTESTKEIAQRYQLKESNVLMILSRTRKKLNLHLKKGGFLV